mmetsp:Transcript_31404/g.31945  ORF Transcript_31404/g.31945 Transcript_31404/m.31945 type:complete len:220 (+) Transcript_31404:291-950(+)
MVRAIGAIVTDNPEDATHLVTSETLKRTPKLMIAINAGVKYIVTFQWLQDSFALGDAIPINTLNSLYIVRDPEKEKLWGFNMMTTLSSVRGPHVSGVFHDIAVYVPEAVFGEKFPPKDQMRQIIQCGGGRLIDQLSECNTAVLKKIVVVSVEGCVERLSPEEWEAAKGGPGCGVYSAEFIFLATLRQRIDFNCGVLEAFPVVKTTKIVKRSERKGKGKK